MFTCKVCNFMEWQCSCCSCCSIQLYISKGLYIITTYISTCTYVYISYVHAYICALCTYVMYLMYMEVYIYVPTIVTVHYIMYGQVRPQFPEMRLLLLTLLASPVCEYHSQG